MLNLTSFSLKSYFQPDAGKELDLLFVQHYQGPANQSFVETMLQLIEESEIISALPLSFRKRLFLVVIEGLQNCVKYGDKENSRYPVIGFRIEVLRSGEARLCFGNFVSFADQQRFSEQLKSLAAKSSDSLRQLYILRSREKVVTRDSKPSAGLGLIEITRCAAQLRYHFEPKGTASWFEMEIIVR
jgi:anti-sigma regulatory factor (Ser/Thr protein kinase)